MARSKKHHPFRGITGSPSEKQDKRLANRCHRRVVKKAVLTDREVLPCLRELSDVWGFDKDGKFLTKDPKDLRK